MSVFWTLRPAQPPRWTAVLFVLCVSVALGLYFLTGLFDFVSFDDPSYVSRNPAVLAGITWRSALEAFSLRQALYWHPLTTLSLLVDGRMFRGWAGGYHVVNALWHGGNVALLFLLALRLTGSRAAAVLCGLLLAAHPVHVESVAWISERKDVLSTFFGLASIHYYIGWRTARRPATAAAMYACYALSLLAKPTFVIAPALLLLLDYWPLGRLAFPPKARRVAELLREKVLFIAFGTVSTVMTFATHSETRDRLDPDLWLKLANASASIAKYLALLVFPHEMAIVYPFPDSVPLWQSLGGGALALGLTGLCVWQARLRPYLLFGWLWFLCALAPVLMPPRFGLHVALADRWTYVPYMGLYLALGALCAERLRAGWSRRVRVAAVLAGGAALTLLAVAQQRQLDVWRCSESLYGHALRITTGSHMVLNNYGVLKLQQGDVQAGERAYLDALAIFPDFALCKSNLGALRMGQGRTAEAMELLWQAASVMARQSQAYDCYLGLADGLVREGRLKEAEHFLAAAVRENPHSPEAYLRWGRLAQRRGDISFAHAFFNDLAGKGTRVGTVEDLAAIMAARAEASRSPAAGPEPAR
jgi:Tfp pilus assembly protein PilF